MEPLGPASRLSHGLPPINHLNDGSVKREDDYQRKHSAAAMVSPSHPFPASTHSNPYSNHQSPHATSRPAGSLGGLLSPPDSRRTSDGKEQRQHARLSLPSISEALRAAPQPAAQESAPPPFFPPLSTAPPPDLHPRTFSIDHINNQGPPHSFLHSRQTHAPIDLLSRPPPYSAQHNPKLPALHPLRTTQSPPPVTASRPNPPYPSYPPLQQSGAHESPAPHSAGPMQPPPYGYSQYPSSNHPLSAPAPISGGPNSAYPAPYSAPPNPKFPPPIWRSENPVYGRAEHDPLYPHSEVKKERAVKMYHGEVVKRNLDNFDLEALLNEMADGAGRLGQFAKNYGTRAHDPQYMPRLEEVDEMIKYSDKIGDSLQHMRKLAFDHQQASLSGSHREALYRPISGYDPEGQTPFQEDPKTISSFSALDPNKRQKRGRAAPPGRCHSCNRAETPEWRRGPDGARTLCNACGLHYAKLTRKCGKQGTTMTSSNLRPKSLGEGSPTA